MILFFIRFNWFITNGIENVEVVVIYIDSPDWIKQKKETTNPKKENDKCFQYAVMVELNRAEIEPHSERVSNIKPFINDYN